MARTYTLKRRAEQQADTRRRIVETAVELHGSVGPAATTYSMLAERAGVQRHTLYAHFPDERTLLLACSGLTMERDAPPEAGPWQAVTDPAERLQRGLGELYDWYARNAALLGCVLRDAEHHELTREIAGMRFGPYMAAYRQMLGGALNERQRALLEVALSYFTWRSLTRDGGQDTPTAAATMAEALIRLG